MTSNQIVNSCSLPLNLLTVPNLPDFASLASLGVMRVSTGDFVFEKMMRNLSAIMKEIDENQNADSLFE